MSEDWIDYNDREDMRRTYADRQRAETFGNSIADYGRTEEDARLANMQQCDVCNMMLVELLPEHRWICTSCGNGITSDLIRNPEYIESKAKSLNFPVPPSELEQEQHREHNSISPSVMSTAATPTNAAATTTTKKSTRILIKTGQSPDVSTGVAPSLQRKGVIVSKDIHAVGRHGKPFRSNQTDPIGTHPLDRELVQQGFQLKEVRDVSAWSVKSKSMPKGPPVNLDE